MATAGLSLVGFMTNLQQAINHLRHDCVNPGADDAGLTAMWQAAQGALGAPFPAAGDANPQPLPATMQPYIQSLVAQPWVVERLQELAVIQMQIGQAPATFQMVDIEPLLAYQFIVDTKRATDNCRTLSDPPTEAELLDLCLPAPQPREEYFRTPVTDQSQSVVIKLRNHNLQMHRWGIFDAMHGEQVAGVSFHVGLPFLHVVRLGGRCYLHNGYHRAYGAARAGATRLPCIFREVTTPQHAGIRLDGSTFDAATLTSANPPTIGHFTQGRAHTVQLRPKSRLLHVTWQQYSVPDEYD